MDVETLDDVLAAFQELLLSEEATDSEVGSADGSHTRPDLMSM